MATSNNTPTALLKPHEVTACKQLAASDLADNKRAVALLAIHQGQTQAAAAELSGLSAGQVKYILGRFRQRGMKALSQLKSSVESTADGVADKASKAGDKAKADKKTDKSKKTS